MKIINFEVPVKVLENPELKIKEFEFKIKGEYSAPENMAEIKDMFKEETILKTFLTGLRQIERNRIRAENNIMPVAKKLVDLKIYKTLEESVNFLLVQKGLK